MVTVFISLGSNQAPREHYMVEMVREVSGVLLPPINLSRLMETEPVEVFDRQDWYLNRVVSGSFNGTARDLLVRCLEIERRLGRVRERRHGSRTADIDILLFGDTVVHEKDLDVPHPRMFFRRFCLEGLREIAPLAVLPEKGCTIQEYWATLPDAVLTQKVTFLPEGNRTVAHPAGNQARAE